MPHVKSAPGQGRVPLDNGFDAFENSNLNVDVTLPLAAAALAAGKIVVIDNALPPLLKSSSVPVDLAFGLSQVKTKRFQNQRFSGPTVANTSVTLFSDTGAGMIRYLWLAAASSFLSLDGRIQVFTDGNAQPDIDIDIGTLGLLHNDANTAAGGSCMGTPHWHGESAGGAAIQTCVALRFPIPYSNGVTVKLYSPNGAGTIANGWYFQCSYQDGVTAPYRLKSIGRSWAGGNLTPPLLGANITIPATNAQNLFDIHVPKPSWLVWTGFCEKGGPGASWTFLERDVQLTVDGESSPSWRSSGTEDFFGGAFYYVGHMAGGWGWINAPTHSAAFTNTTNYTANQGLDHLEQVGGLLFNSELKADLLTEAAVTVPHTMTHVSLYYQSI